MQSDSPYHCGASYSERHQPTYDNGALVTDTTGLGSVCQHCGAILIREHKKSAWWRDPAAARFLSGTREPEEGKDG